MSTDGGHAIRGSRPSRYGLPEEASEEAEVIRLANIEQYTRRAQAGLPIFDEAGSSVAVIHVEAAR